MCPNPYKLQFLISHNSIFGSLKIRIRCNLLIGAEVLLNLTAAIIAFVDPRNAIQCGWLTRRGKPEALLSGRSHWVLPYRVK